MHDRFVRLILKVAVPATLEMWSRPLLHLTQFFIGRAYLDAGFNAIGGEWTRALEVPFIEDRFLDFRYTADKVVEALGV